MQHGGLNGTGSFGCPSGFVGVGHMCFLFPVKEPASYDEMNDECGLDASPYAPISKAQNTVVKGLAGITVMRHQISHYFISIVL